MADNDEMMGEDSLTEETSSKKGGFAGALLPMLKWIIIAVAAVILIVVVVIVTIKVAGGNKASATTVAISEEYTGQRELLDWYTSLDVTQVFTADEIPATARVHVYLGYKKDDKATSTEITQRQVELREFMRRYFSGKTAAELKSIQNEDRLKIELKNAINDKILSGSKIRDVAFVQKDVIEQN